MRIWWIQTPVQEGETEALELQWQPEQHKWEASANSRSLSRATGRLAPDCAADIGYLLVSKADKATQFTELALWYRRQTKTKINR